MKGFDDKFFGTVFYPLKFFQNKADVSNKVQKRIIWNKKSDKAVFILPQWMGEMYYYEKLIRSLSKTYTVALYKIPNKIINDNAQKTTKYFEKSKKEIIDMTNILSRNGCKDFSIIGVSITSSLALMVANEDERYTKIVLGSIGDDFAESFWDSGNRVVKNIKRKMMGNGVNLASLRFTWKSIAPKNNIQNLNGRNMLILLSKNDQLVRYEHGLRFINLIKNKRIKYKVEIDSIYGHYLFILRRLLAPEQIVSFLEN